MDAIQYAIREQLRYSPERRNEIKNAIIQLIEVIGAPYDDKYDDARRNEIAKKYLDDIKLSG